MEVKKEDELKKDIPPPEFLKEAKPEDEWSVLIKENLNGLPLFYKLY